VFRGEILGKSVGKSLRNGGGGTRWSVADLVSPWWPARPWRRDEDLLAMSEGPGQQLGECFNQVLGG
jgi:hypothetical protein